MLTHTHTPVPVSGWHPSVPLHERYERVTVLPYHPSERAVRVRVIRRVPASGFARAWNLVLHEWNETPA